MTPKRELQLPNTHYLIIWTWGSWKPHRVLEDDHVELHTIWNAQLRRQAEKCLGILLVINLVTPYGASRHFPLLDPGRFSARAPATFRDKEKASLN